MEESQPVFSSDAPTPVAKKSFSLKSLFGGQLPLILCLTVIIAMVIAWRPSEINSSPANARTIAVTGEAEITAEPDEYVFTPEYDFKSADQKTALSNSTAKTNEIVKKLKDLGVADSKIKTDTGGYGSYYDDSQQTYYAYLTIKVDDKKLAQKVQDYLLTTTPYGSVSPQADFSKATRKKLTDTARDQATKDARAKAEQSAANLGFKIGKVKSVDDNSGNDPFQYYGDKMLMSGANTASVSDSAPIQQGENSLSYQVKVVYYMR